MSSKFQVSRSKSFQWLEISGAQISNHWKFFVAAIFLSCRGPVSASSLHMPVSGVDPKSGLSITIGSAFDKLPYCGYAPLRLTIRNDSAARHSWDFTFTSASPYGDRQGFRSSTSVDVDAKAERIVEIMVPLATQSGGYAYPQLTTSVVGYGCGGGARELWSGTYAAAGRSATPFTMLSETLGISSWLPLETKLKGSGVDLTGGQFDPKMAPGDYRGWLGCDSVWLSSSDWEAFDSIHRQALLDWTKLGGDLHVCFLSGDKNTALADLPAGDTPLGFGRIARVAVKDNSKFVDHIAHTIRGGSRLLDTIHSGYVAGWSLRAGIPPVVVHTGLILGFVIVFAVLIGPVNLFALARRKKHMHLFWTTPALSIAASIALAFVIVLQDGFGGHGNRFNAIYLDAAAHKAFTVQEQVSRTGVLLARRIPMHENFFMTAVQCNPGLENRNRNYALEGDSLTGDWFSSRSVDAHLLLAAQSSRARVEISPAGEAPSVTSGIGTTLGEIYYRDARQRVWHAEGVKTGERQIMRPSTAAALSEWWTRRRGFTGGYLRMRLLDIADQDNFFFAAAEGPAEQIIPTLPAIVWKQDTLLYFGPVAAAGGPP
jgi:hypothetical protein